MPFIKLRNLSCAILLLLLPEIIYGQGHERVLEEINNGLIKIVGATILALGAFLLLVIFRNRYLGWVSIVGAILLIVTGTDEITRYLLTDTFAEIYNSTGFLLIALSVILGWVYQKRPRTSTADTPTPEETSTSKSKKRRLTLNVVFLYFVLTNFYTFITFYLEPYNTFVLTQAHVLPIVIFIIITLTTYLFITKTQAGWIMGAGYLISFALVLFINQVNTLNIYFTYHAISLPFSIFSVVYLACAIICLRLVLSGPLRDHFSIKKKQIFLSLGVGIALNFLSMYTSIISAEMRADMEMRKRMENLE